MPTIQVTALDSFVHGTLNVHKHAQLELPESSARDLIKAGLLSEGHSARAAAPVSPVQKPGRGKRAPSNKVAGPQDNKGDGLSSEADAGGATGAAAGDEGSAAGAEGGDASGPADADSAAAGAS